jgi:transposase
MTIGIDLVDVWSHYCTLNEDAEVVGRGRFRTSPSGVEKWFTDLPRVRIAMETGTHSIWISEQLQELGHESDRGERARTACDLAQRSEERSDAEKLARYARLDPKILRPIAHRTVAQQEALTLIRARNLIVRLRTAAVNAVRGLAKPCGYRLPASSNHVLGPHGRDSTLRQWGLHLASRGGKQSRNRAIVAVARKLAVLLHRIWITQEPYIPFYGVAA